MTTKRKNILIAALFTGVILAYVAALVLSGRVEAEHFVANVVGTTVITIGGLALLWYLLLRSPHPPRPPRYKLGAILYTIGFLMFCVGAALNPPHHWDEYVPPAAMAACMFWLWFNAIRHWHDNPEPPIDGPRASHLS